MKLKTMSFILMSSGLSVTGFIFPSQVRAQADQAICAVKNPAAYEMLTQLPQGTYAAWWPEFLERTLPNGEKEIWAAIMCSKKPNVISGGGNCLVKLTGADRGKIIDSPGVYDGQWTRDKDSEPLFTAPNKFNQSKGGLEPGLTFFRQQDVVQLGDKAKPIFHDPVFGNHYHSFGVAGRGTENGKRFVIHRVMNDKWGASYRDFKAILDAKGETIEIAAMGPETNLTNARGDTEVVKTHPKNQADENHHRSYYDLPMISADGRFFAVNNRKTMTAQIFEITKDGKKLAVDLGFEAGKISFAPQKPGSNELMIAFHVDQVDPAEGDKMSSTPRHMTKDVIAMKLEVKKNAQGETVLERKEAHRITSSALSGDGNFYPKWINDHELIFIQERNDRQGFVKVDMNLLKTHATQMQAIGVIECEDCKEKPKFEAVVALGKMFADSCTNISAQISAREAQLYTLQLTPDTCAQLTASWEKNKDKVLSAKSLYSLRSPKDPGEQRVSGYNFAESYSKRGAERKEKPANRDEVQKITVKDLQAVCQALKK